MKSLPFHCCGILLLLTACLFAQPGSLDNTFGAAGKVITAFGSGDDYAQSTVIQADGKIVVAGYASNGNYDVFAIARYLPNGTLDSSFSNDGRQTTSFGVGDHRAYAVALQADGKIVVGGYATIDNEFDFAIARYKPDGSPDPTFSGDGKTTTNLGGFFDKAYSMVIQPDGYIVLGGVFGQTTNSDFGVVRYRPNGTLDPDFGNAGISTLSVGNSYDELHGLALQADGKLVAAGFTSNGTDYDFALARFTAHGQPDLSFNGTGKQTADLGLGDYGQSVAVQPDGAIVLLGYTAVTNLDYDFALLRYLPDGLPDPAFGQAGVVVTSITSSFDAGYALALRPDGKILAGGYAAGSGHPDFALASYLPDGQLDTDFGALGIATTDFTAGTDQIAALALAPTGKIVAVGRSNNGADFDFGVARYISGPAVGVVDISSPELELFIAPNPVAEQTMLRYTLKTETSLSLALFDFSGRLVQSFFENERQGAGWHYRTLLFEKNMAAGNYLLVMNDNQGNRWRVQIMKK